MEHRGARILAVLILGLLALPMSAQTLDDADALQMDGRLPEAVRAYRAVAEAAGQSDPETAATARNNACVLLTQLGDFRSALSECEAALRIRRALGDTLRIARTLNNTGLCLHYLGDYDEAENRFREALEVNRLRGDAESQVINLSNLGLVATSEGRYNRALDRHAAAASLAAQHTSEPWAGPQIDVARINQGVVLEKLGAYREALGLYREVLAHDAQGAQNTRLDPRRRASLRVNAGVVYRNLGDPVSALDDFREAIRIYEAEGDKAGLSNAWLNIGLVHHLNLKQPREAEEAYRTALRLAEESGDRSEEIQDLFYLGWLLLEQKRLDEAERVFSRSLDDARKSGSAEGRWSALDGLGRIAAARGQEERAVELLEQAMAEIETVRGTLRRGSLRALFFGEKRPVYAAAIELLARLDARKPGAGYAERALAVVQRAKVRELLDALGGSGTASPLGADQLREKVGDGLLLEYFLGERNLYLWVVRGDGVELADLGPARPILDDALAVHAALSRSQEPDPTRLARLSKTLLGPAGEIRESEVRIAPDGALRYLPFELLPVSGTIAGAPLVERAATSYLPSGSALGWLRQLADFTPVYTLAGLGAPDISNRSRSGSAAGELTARYNLPPLPGAARELDSLSRLLPGRHTLLTGASDTESNFRAVVHNGVRIVHLATHTVIDERPGRGAAILFSPGAPGTEDDGLLYPEEIAGLQYRADLSVLAGCRTAIQTGDGDALATLTGSFLAAGSPSVLATLWEVGDDTTAAFMQQLYHELGKGRRPAEALRRAKQRFREDPRWKRPDLWAGYVLIGEAPRVAYSDRTRYVIGIAVLAVLALTPWLLDRKPGSSAAASPGPPGGSPLPEEPARAG
jgi:tetratricopeptide (TPR) repeat protein